MQKIIFGPAVDSKNGIIDDLVDNLKTALSFSDEVVELSFTAIHRVVFDQKVIDLVNKFKYKSIHLPVVDESVKEKTFLVYPNENLNEMLKKVDKLIDKILPNTILIHPDQVKDFLWVKSKYGKMLAFENMDSKKIFGRTLEDMERVFSICPEAGWVCDVNHIYTNDQTMELSNALHQSLKSRLRHYHLSGYGGFHDALCLSQEKIILKGIKLLDYPIVDEGNLIQKKVLQKEYDYVVKHLSAYNS